MRIRSRRYPPVGVLILVAAATGCAESGESTEGAGAAEIASIPTFELVRQATMSGYDLDVEIAAVVAEDDGRVYLADGTP